ncbi:unnamed protein product [Schistocephalus solidus]|uniref:Glycosyltransferase n=1 Tax=Schistocephalus solidus TaxID=70667 RepID=A0A183TAZ4_SCHSO|nr:unnamed protein product [Schistocephalus solidus]
MLGLTTAAADRGLQTATHATETLQTTAGTLVLITLDTPYSPLTLAAWNVRSILDYPRSSRPEQRTALVVRELAHYKADIVAIS